MTSIGSEPVSLALGGDVMTGRGIDQILPHPGDPTLYESYVQDAREYVDLGVQANGAISLPVAFEYVWGDALPAMLRADVRIVNLETSITSAPEHWPFKEVHYRMNPRNVGCLKAAHLDCCGLANNHVLDWGHQGLEETLRTLRGAGLGHAGAGHTAAEAAAAAVLPVPNKGRVLVAAVGSPSSGIPVRWAAGEDGSGINLVEALDASTARRLAHDLLRTSQPDDVTVMSVHWGRNWAYEIPDEQIEFAHVLVDEGIDVVHGHSSHHAKAIELRRHSVILYGCGDFLNDYEGIGGQEEFRGDLSVLYRVKITSRPRRSAEVSLLPFQLRRFRLNQTSTGDARWLCAVLNHHGARFGTTIELETDNTMKVRLRQGASGK